jgi:hypothetical protein
MNNLQKAYIQGFIKRAQAYNVSSNAALAILEKQALGWDTFQNVGEGITNAAKKVTNIPGNIGGLINRGGERLSGAIRSVGNDVQNGLTNFANNADRYAALPGRIGTALEEVAPSAVQGGQGLSQKLHGVTDAFRQAGNKLNTAMQQGAGGISSYAGGRANKLQQMSDTANRYAEMPAAIGRQATNMGKQIQNAIEGNQPTQNAPSNQLLQPNAGVNPDAFSAPTSLSLGNSSGNTAPATQASPEATRLLNPRMYGLPQ